MNCQKYTRNQASNILVHCNRSDPNRTYGNQEIDHQKTYLNYNLAPVREISDFEFMKNRCEELKILKRKDVNWMVSWVITIPQDYTADEKDFFNKTYDFLTDKYGEENTISAYVHYDETSPHMHFTFVPVILDVQKQEYKVNAKRCINKYELQKIHTEMQNYLEQELKTNVNILNGATKTGNKSIRQLKETTEIKEIAIKELLEKPTKDIINKVIEQQLKSCNKEKQPKKISIKPLSADEIEKLGKKDARQELKIKLQELDTLKEEYERVFSTNLKYSNSLQLAQKLENENDKLETNIREVKQENYTLKSDYQKLSKRYNKILDLFEYFINAIKSIFFSIQNIFTAEQKENNPETMEKLEYISNTDVNTILNDVEDNFDSAERKKKIEKNRDYDLEL